MKGRRTYNGWLGFLILSFFIFHLSPSYALPMNIECQGAHEVDGADTLFFFANEIHVRSKIGAVDWYSTTTGEPVVTDQEDVYSLDNGGYYIVKNGVEYSPFYVFVCKPANIEMTVEAECEAANLNLSGNTEQYRYFRRDGSFGTYARTCSIEYTTLAWKEDAWIDSLVTTTAKVAKIISIPQKFLRGTHVRICYDEEIRLALGLPLACADAELPESDVKAVSMMMTSLATTRGTEGEKSNELNRPTRQDIITATTSESYSGPLNVAFYSNPTPAAQFIRWTIYKASERLVSYQDKDIRYTFSEPNIYRVVCTVSNMDCTSDSSEMIVNVAESYLRVPNFFTPGGSCPNAEFRVAYRSLKEFHIWVYNRWGKLVYESTDPEKGWDGRINGKLAADGAYFYVVRALGTDANRNNYISLKASYNKKKANDPESVLGVYQLSGDINLLRCRK